MAMIAVQIKIDGERVITGLQEAREKLDSSADGELVLDFSAVRRLNARALRAMEEFAAAAAGKGVKVVLRGTRVDIYKVLKLMNSAARFSFSN